MKERVCDFKLVAFVDGERIEIKCDPAKGCLYDLLWSGIGIQKAAAQMLNKESSEGIQAYAEGRCFKENNTNHSL